MNDSPKELDGFELSPITKLPLASSISVVILLAFNDKGEILTIHNPRGWDFPGGHVEQQETPKDTLYREAFEEAYVKIRAERPFASACTSNNTGKYADKYMIFYLAELKEVLPFLGEFETSARAFVSTDQFIKTYGGGAPLLAQEVLRLAESAR